MMRLIWHPLALDDMRRIINYCRETFGLTVAAKVRNQLKHDASLLKQHPALGCLEEELNGGCNLNCVSKE